MPFTRETVRHDLVLRRVEVTRVTPLTPTMVRITVGGAELDGFASVGPSDHVKLFFPEPATGEVTVPQPGPDGRRQAGTDASPSRDYTPRAIRPGELDLDFVVHGAEGPATVFAAGARPGDKLGIGGPRGSRLVPHGIHRLVIVADETAFPTTARWLDLLPPEVTVTALFDAADETASAYFTAEETARTDARWLFRTDGTDQLEPALRSLGPIDDSTYVVLAGEADTLVPLRRYLRRELQLPAEQVSASGYWRRGVVALDHHAPLDPSDPD